jgi:predicted RecA/RadA family phage recombinase
MSATYAAAYKAEGRSVAYTPTVAVVAGQVVVQESLVGIAKNNISANVQDALAVEGIFTISKDSSVFNVGDKVYWSGTQATRTAQGNAYMGVAVSAQVTGDTTVDCKLGYPATGTSGLLYSAIAASSAISNTTTETAFSTGQFTIGANELLVGDTIKVKAQGIFTAVNSTNTQTVKLYFGSAQVVATLPAINPNANDIFYIDAEIVIRTIGNANTGTFVAIVEYNTGTPGTATSKMEFIGSTAVDTTVGELIQITSTCSVANAGNSVRLDIMDVSVSRR